MFMYQLQDLRRDLGDDAPYETCGVARCPMIFLFFGDPLKARRPKRDDDFSLSRRFVTRVQEVDVKAPQEQGLHHTTNLRHSPTRPAFAFDALLQLHADLQRPLLFFFQKVL